MPVVQAGAVRERAVGEKRMGETDELFFDERACGCLLGLACGDALGAPVEFIDRAGILRRYGPDGIRGFAPHHGLPAGSWTDDTQLAVATAHGILDWRAESGWVERAGTPSDLDALTQSIWRRYLEWSRSPECPQGSPGATTLAALRAGRLLTLDDPVNPGGKGCGGVMRVAPLGLVGLGEVAFEAGARAGTLTHRHPTSDAACGFLALLIDHLVDVPGPDLVDAVNDARKVLITWPGHSSSLDAVDTAVRLAAECGDPYVAIGQIGHVGKEGPHGHGKGWVAEEALGIGLYCALRFPEDFAAGVGAAVNISGDSDSTGAVCGAIMGAVLGASAIPAAWRRQVANADELAALGARLAAVSDDHHMPGSTDEDQAATRRRPLTSADVDALLAYLPWLESLERAMRDGGPVDPDHDVSALHERMPAASIERLYDFLDELYARGWMVVFDWRRWDIGKPAFDDPAMIADFDLSTLRRELTTIGRADRFAGGTCESALARGVYSAIVRRLAELRENGEAP